MSTHLYDVELAISALDNVRRWTPAGKRNARKRAARNMEATLATGAKCGVITETWPAWVKAGIYDAAPANIRFQTEPGQSVMTWIDAEWAIPGGKFPVPLHGRYPTQWDERHGQVIETHPQEAVEDPFWLEGWHTAPLKSRFPAVYRAGERAHDIAAESGMRRINIRKRPTVVAGDLNTKRLLPNYDRIAGLNVGNGICHAEFFNGDFAAWGKPTARAFELESDHPGVRVSVPVLARQAR